MKAATEKPVCAQSFDKTEDEVQVLAPQVVRHKEVVAEYDTDTRSATVRKFISLLDGSEAKATEPSWKQHSEFGTFTPHNAAATELFMVAITRWNTFCAPDCTRLRHKQRTQTSQAELSLGTAGKPILLLSFSLPSMRKHVFNGVLSLIGSLVAHPVKRVAGGNGG